MELKHIAIAGNIGAGKTTLTRLLSKYYGWEPHYEEVDTNPYIDDFYQDMHRWSFHMQVYFLNTRLQQIIKIGKEDKTVIQDRSIFEDAQIFAPNLHEMGLMTKRDFDNYKNIFDTISTLIPPPDLIIYLKGSLPALVDNIEKRGRVYEENIRLDYLKKLNVRYDDFALNYPHKIITIDIDEKNFEENPDDLGFIINIIDREKSGLF